VKTSKETRKAAIGSFLSVVGGLMIIISGFSRGALGGNISVYGYAEAMFILFFGIILGVLLGITILVSALAKKRIVVIILSAISLFYFPLIYQSLIYDDVHLYVLPILLAVIGSICGILGGIMIGRKTDTKTSEPKE